MSLPFLKPRRVSGVIVTHRSSDSLKEQATEEQDYALESCAEDLIRAVHAKDGKAVASALQAAYDVCHSNHKEDDSEEDFDSQNEQAAE